MERDWEREEKIGTVSWVIKKSKMFLFPPSPFSTTTTTTQFPTPDFHFPRLRYHYYRNQMLTPAIKHSCDYHCLIEQKKKKTVSVSFSLFKCTATET